MSYFYTIITATVLVYTLIDSKRYDDALIIIKQYIEDFNIINEKNEVMFYALARLYKVLNINDELRSLNKVIKKYQKHIDELMLEELFEEDYFLD